MLTQRLASRSIQKGQAAVAVMLFLAVMTVSGLALYKSGKLTSDKMQLQNAADAAAYSMSLVEARDLNFAAYMNRAIVANEVAVGQLVGLASWAFHWRSFADFLMAYDTCCIGPATLGVSTPIMQSITNIAWRVPGEAFINILSPIANFGTTVLHNINKFYGLAQYGYHIVSIIFAVGVLDEMINQNAPPGARISDFGIVALITHIATYGVLPNLPGEQFVSAYSPTKSEPVDDFKQGGYGRLAALIRDARDPFTKGRGWELRPPGFPIDIDVSESFKLDLGVASAEFGFRVWFHLDISLERKGSSELRVILPASGNVNAKRFNWSSADTTGLFFEIAGGFRAWVELCALGLCEEASVGGSVSLANSRLDVTVEILGIEIEIIPGMPFPTSAPFGAGFAQAGKTTPNKLHKPKMTLAPIGPIEPEHYGEAANNLLAWESPGILPLLPVGVSYFPDHPITATKSHVNKRYAGLPHYVDTTGNESFLGIGAPNLIIGLVLDEADFDMNAAGSGAETEPVGRLGLTEQLADNELAVIAKSELYFSRPTDKFASHFFRADGQTEFGNGFNPYWQARLIDTSYPDRIIALFIQQKEPGFLNLVESFNLFFSDILSYLPGGA